MQVIISADDEGVSGRLKASCATDERICTENWKCHSPSATQEPDRLLWPPDASCQSRALASCMARAAAASQRKLSAVANSRLKGEDSLEGRAIGPRLARSSLLSRSLERVGSQQENFHTFLKKKQQQIFPKGSTFTCRCVLGKFSCLVFDRQSA